MITSFTPCLNYITGSTSGNRVAAPTSDCCNSLRSLMSTSMDCTCLIVTGNVPVSLPFNANLAISLPQACSGSVPLQCKASGVPLPAPGPVLFGPSASPAASASTSSTASNAADMTSAAAETTEDITPASPPVASLTPMANPGIRPVVTSTSASNPSYVSSSTISILLIFVGIMVFK
ncbi:unnamed protein product [Ilex paraguariensis]